MSELTGKDFYDMSGPDLLAYCGADASKWAEAFCRIKEAQGWGAADIDEGLMIGWFANAIEHSQQVRAVPTPAQGALKGWLYTLRGTESFSPTRLPHCIALGWHEIALYDASFSAPDTTIPSTENMDERFAWLEAKAIDMGYVLVPEPEHPDSPHNSQPPLPGLVTTLRSHADDCENMERWATPELAPLLRRAADVIESGVSPVTEGQPAKSDLQEALGGLVQIIEAAGLYQLSTGVELGPTVWYVKASDALAYAKSALTAARDTEGKEPEAYCETVKKVAAVREKRLAETLDRLCIVEADLSRLRQAAVEACDFLAERTYGNAARSPGHNARVRLEGVLKNIPDPQQVSSTDHSGVAK